MGGVDLNVFQLQ